MLGSTQKHVNEAIGEIAMLNHRRLGEIKRDNEVDTDKRLANINFPDFQKYIN